MGDTIVYSGQQDLYKGENIYGGLMVGYQTGRFSANFDPWCPIKHDSNEPPS